MPDLVAADVTVTVEREAWDGARRRRNRCKIAFGDGSKTYPSGGVPLPAAANFGMRGGVLDFLILTDDNDAEGVVWKYDQDNKKLRGYIQGAVTSAAGSGTLDDFPLDGTADPYAAAGRQPGDGAVSVGLVASEAGTVYIGRLKEFLAAEHAPPAQTLYAEAVGF